MYISSLDKGLGKQPWVFLLFAAFFLLKFLHDLKTGSTLRVYQFVKRSEDAFGYWSNLSYSAVLGIASLLWACYLWWPRLFSW